MGLDNTERLQALLEKQGWHSQLWEHAGNRSDFGAPDTRQRLCTSVTPPRNPLKAAVGVGSSRKEGILAREGWNSGAAGRVNPFLPASPLLITALPQTLPCACAGAEVKHCPFPAGKGLEKLRDGERGDLTLQARAGMGRDLAEHIRMEWPGELRAVENFTLHR